MVIYNFRVFYTANYCPDVSSWSMANNFISNVSNLGNNFNIKQWAENTKKNRGGGARLTLYAAAIKVPYENQKPFAGDRLMPGRLVVPISFSILVTLMAICPLPLGMVSS